MTQGFGELFLIMRRVETGSGSGAVTKCHVWSGYDLRVDNRALPTDRRLRPFRVPFVYMFRYNTVVGGWRDEPRINEDVGRNLGAIIRA